MKRNITFLIFLMYSSFSYAQVTREAYEKAVDFVNCKAMEVVENSFREKCDCSTFPNKNEISSKVPESDGKTRLLLEEIDRLKLEYNENKSTTDIISFLSDKIFQSSQYSKIKEFAVKERPDKTKFIKFKAQLTSELPKILNPTTNNGAEDKKDTQEITDATQSLLTNDTSKPNSEGLIDNTVFQIIVSIVLLALLGMIIMSKMNNKTTNYSQKIALSSEVKEIIKDEMISMEMLNKNNNKLYKIEALERDIKRLQSELDSLKLQKPSQSFDTITVQEKKQEVNPPAMQEQVFYLSTPNQDGSFNDTSSTNTFKEGATIYCLKKRSHNKAEFSIEPRESSIRLAIQYPERNIEPVCDSTNAFNAHSKKIETVSPGEVQLNGDKWTLVKKAKIRYES